ncbi:threonine-phosphate decarboxylase CobD [Marinobacter nanhaiticus D15-8W]|uniref:threonine-phosphate decarboxylase n=1 Tax=Marinobacter nanhaiticus D15-8W TaxID=626887 RepID=N6W250_9GAMM|nr:threonine-phosphate decarboxylase CobD [Marinobacter nanhaiticus]ENO14169.1 threonine-phosphate decarboxylase [Marinobacter nanhaiticus D15-8W]BES71554.1 threonine-phosphate decarboxylase CobD [Marinobacter nanhaiticus D15-8W]
MDSREPLHHGGRLGEAARRWGIPREQWLDLSTGINPYSWPVPVIPGAVWQRLPEDDDGLADILRSWSGAPQAASCLPVPGSQSVIQTLPRLREPCRVGVPVPGYEEHARCWAQSGHTIVPVDPSRADDDEQWLDELDVLVWINPNNPTGDRRNRSQLLHWHDRLCERGGWLVIDEAFLLPDEFSDSLASAADREGLVVLKSLGKFFGLAGLRAGAVFGDRHIVSALEAHLGPWSLSHPARFVMAKVLEDRVWPAEMQVRLRDHSGRLDSLLKSAGLPLSAGTALFRYVDVANAHAIADGLAEQGILVRRFDNPAALRFGLPGAERDWARLESALASLLGSAG